MANRYTQAELARYARQAGFPENKIPTIVAIAMGESSGNPRAHNPDASTGDNSYGLMQINMLGQMGADRRAQFGLSSNEELFDPVTNFAAAKTIYDSQGLGAWGAYTNGSYKDFLPTSTQAAKDTVGQTNANNGGLSSLEQLGYRFDGNGRVSGLDPVAYLKSLGVGGTSGSDSNGNTYNTVIQLLNPQDKNNKTSFEDRFTNHLLQQAMQGKDQGGYDPMAILKQQGFLNPTGYLKYVNQ
jgi:hypothetical protein